MVQLAGETKLDACPGDYRADLADSLPGHPGQLWVRVRSGDPSKSSVAGGIALRHQPCGEPDLHADPVRDEKPAAGCGGYSDRLDHNHLVRHRHMAALQMGRCGSSAVFRLGVAGDGAATLDHSDELGKIMIPGLSQTTITQVMASGLVDPTLDTITDK